MTRERKEIGPTFAVSPGCSAVTLWVPVACPHPLRCAKQKCNCREQQPASAREGSEGKRSRALPTGTAFHAAPAPGCKMDPTLFLSVFLWFYMYIYISPSIYVCTSAGFGVLWNCCRDTAVWCEAAVTPAASPAAGAGGDWGARHRSSAQLKQRRLPRVSACWRGPAPLRMWLTRLRKCGTSSVIFLSLPHLSGQGSFALTWMFLSQNVQKVTPKLVTVWLGLPQNQVVIFLLDGFLMRGKPPLRTLLWMLVPRGSVAHRCVPAPTGRSAGGGHRQRAVVAMAQAACLPLQTSGGFMVLKSSTSVVTCLGTLAQDLVGSRVLDSTGYFEKVPFF